MLFRHLLKRVATNDGVRLHDDAFVAVQFPGFIRMWSGNPTLPMSCSGATLQHFNVGGRNLRGKRGMLGGLFGQASAEACNRVRCIRFRCRGTTPVGQRQHQGIAGVDQIAIAVVQATSSS